MAGVHFKVTGDANGYIAATRQAEAATKGMVNRVTDEAKRIDNIFKSLATGAGALFTVQMASQFTKQVAQVRGEFQQLEVAFETMLQSKEKADALMAQVVDTAAKTPFDLQGVANGAKQLLAYGVASEEVNDTLIRLGDIAAGLSIPLNDLVYLYGTTMTQGRLFTQDLRQFQGRGIPIAEELAKQFGVTKDKVGELVTAGKVGFPEVQKAIMAMTSEGGKFNNLMVKQSQTITGQISNLEDSVSQMFNEIGKASEGTISKAIGLASSLVENYEKVGRIIASLVTTYGAYKAAVIAVSAVEKVQAVARLAAIKNTTLLQVATGALTKKMGLLNAVMKANPYVLAATALIGLGTAVWALSDHTTAAEKAQTRYNKAQEDAVQLENQRKQEIEEALDVARDANRIEGERVEALLKLKSTYPEIFSQYDLEKLKLADILNIKKQIAEEDRKRKTTSIEEDYAANAKWLNEYRKTYNNGSKAFRKEYETRQEEQKLARQAYTDTKVEDYIAGMKDKSTEYLQQILDIAQRANAGNGQFLLEGTEVMSKGMVDLTQLKTLSIEGQNLVAVIESINAELTKRNEVVPSYAVEFKAAEEAWKTAKAKLEAIKKDKEKYTKKEYEDQVSLEEEKRKAFEALGGDTKGKTAKDNDAIRKADEAEAKAKNDAANKALREQEDLDNQVEQARINAMADGAEKRRAQRDLDNAMELQQIKRSKEDFVDAYVERERAIFDAEEAAKSARNKSYQKKIFDEDAARIRAESSETAKQYSANLVYTKRKQEAESREKEAELIRQINDELLGEFKTYEQQRSDITDKYAKAREKLYKKDALGMTLKDKSGKPILKDDATKGNLDEIARAEQEDLAAIDQKFALREAQFQAWMNEIANYTLTQLKQTLEQAEQELAALEARNPNDTRLAEARAKVGTLRKAIKKEEAEDEVSPGKRSIEEWKDLQDVLSDCVDSFDEIGEAVGGVAGEILSTAGSIASQTLGMINGIVQLVNISATGMTATGQSAATAIGMVEKASVILAVISAALQVVTAIINAVKGLADKDNEKEIERLTEANEDLDKSYKKLGRSIEKAYSVDASSLIEQQNALLEQKKANLRLMIAEEKAKKNADEEQIKEWENKINGIETSIEDNAEKAKEAVNGISFDGFRDNFLDALLDMEKGAEGLADTIEEDIRKAMYEALLTDDAFEQQMRNLYNDLAAAIEAGDTREIDRIKASILNLYDRQKEKAREIDEKLGYEPDSTREASEKGIAQASQSSVDELNGRATAIQSHTFSINERVGSIVNLASQLLSRVINIEGHTERLEAIESFISFMRSDISDILTKGIRVKA